MELISNLTWLAVVISLWGLWIAAERRRQKAPLLPRIGLQLIALAVLTAVLLPVISITDDLQADHYPAEVERTSVGRSEGHLAAVPPPGVLPFALALFIFCMAPRPSRTELLRSEDETAARPFQGYVWSLWSRPPPAA